MIIDPNQPTCDHRPPPLCRIGLHQWWSKGPGKGFKCKRCPAEREDIFPRA